jgi:hypothetical protein
MKYTTQPTEAFEFTADCVFPAWFILAIRRHDVFFNAADGPNVVWIEGPPRYRVELGDFVLLLGPGKMCKKCPKEFLEEFCEVK